ncbi:DNA-binding transcriptional dual regulator Crp [compost metagenome]
MQEKEFLKTIFSEKEFKDEELFTILSKFDKVKFAKNEYLLHEGKIENTYWFLESGFIRSFVNDGNGNDITTNFYSSEDAVIDYSSFFLRIPTRENIQALTACICWQIDFETFQQLFHGIESFRDHGRTILVSSYFTLKNHKISIIADQAKERYIQLLQEKPQIVQNVALRHIATFLGITNSSLSRIRKEISL